MDENRLSNQRESNRISIIQTHRENIEINTQSHANDLQINAQSQQNTLQTTDRRQQQNAQRHYRNVIRRVEENIPPLMGGYLPRAMDDLLRVVITDNRRASAARFARVKAAANALIAANQEADRATCLGTFYKECMHYLKNRKRSSYADREQTVISIVNEIALFAADSNVRQFEAIYDSYAELDSERVRSHGRAFKPLKYRDPFNNLNNALLDKYGSDSYEPVREKKIAEAEEKTDHDLDGVKTALQAFEGMKELPFPSISFITGTKKEAYDPKEIENYNSALTGIGTLVTLTCARTCNEIFGYLSKKQKNHLLIEKYQNMLSKVKRQQQALDNAIADSYHSYGEKLAGKTLKDAVKEKPQIEAETQGEIREGFNTTVYKIKNRDGGFELFQAGTTQSALTRVADLLGMGDMITRAIPAVVTKGNVDIAGSVIESPEGEKHSEKEDKYSPKGISAVLSMNVFNILCGRADGEYVVRTGEKDGKTTVDGIQMIAGSGSFDTSLSVEELKKGKGSIAPFDPVMIMCLPEKTKKAIMSLAEVDVELLLNNVLTPMELTVFKQRLGFIKEKIDEQDADIAGLKQRNDPWLSRHGYALEKSDEYRALYYKFYVSKKAILRNKEKMVWESQDERFRGMAPVMIEKAMTQDYGPLENKNLEDPNDIEDQLQEFLKIRWAEFLPKSFLDKKNKPMPVNDDKIPEKLKLSGDYSDYLELETNLQERIRKHQENLARLERERQGRQETLDEIADWKSKSKGRSDALDKAEKAEYGKDVKDRLKEKFRAQGAGFVKCFNEKISGTKLEIIGDNANLLKKFTANNFPNTSPLERRELMIVMEKVFKNFLSIDVAGLSVKDADEFASMEPDRFNTIYRAYWQSLYIKNYIGIYSILLSENKKNGIPIYDCALTEDDLDEIRLRYEVISNATKQVDLMHRIHITNPDEDPLTLMSMSREEILEKKQFWEQKKKAPSKEDDPKVVATKVKLYGSLLDYKYPQGRWKTSLQPDMKAYLDDARKNVYMLEDRTSLISDKLAGNLKRIEDNPKEITPGLKHIANQKKAEEISSDKYWAYHLSEEYIESISKSRDVKTNNSTVCAFVTTKTLGLSDAHAIRMYNTLDMDYQSAKESGLGKARIHEIETAFLALLKCDLSIINKYKGIDDVVYSDDLQEIYNLCWFGYIAADYAEEYEKWRKDTKDLNFSEEDMKTVRLRADILKSFVLDFNAYDCFYNPKSGIKKDLGSRTFEEYQAMSVEDLQKLVDEKGASDQLKRTLGYLIDRKKQYPDFPWGIEKSFDEYQKDMRRKAGLSSDTLSEESLSLISDKIAKAEENFKDKNEVPVNTTEWVVYSNSKKIRQAAMGQGGPDASKAGELRSKAAAGMKELLARNIPLMKPIDAIAMREKGLENRQKDLELAKSSGQDTAAIEADIRFIKEKLEFLRKRRDDKTPITIKVSDSVFGQPEDDPLDREARRDPLFPDGQIPKYDIKQGRNTCYFMAPIIGLIRNGQSSFITEELMHEVDETHVSVRLYDEDGLPIQLVLEKTARDGDTRPLWILMLEKAVAIMTSRTNLGRGKRRNDQDGGAGLVHNVAWEKWDSVDTKEGSVRWSDSSNGNEDLGAMLLFGKKATGMTTRDPDAETYGIGNERSFLLYDYSPEAQTTIGKMSAILSDPSGKKIIVASTCSSTVQDYVNMSEQYAPGSKRFRSHYNPTFDSIEYRPNHYVYPNHAYVFHKADDTNQQFLVTDPLSGKEEWISYDVFVRYFTDVKVMEA